MAARSVALGHADWDWLRGENILELLSGGATTDDILRDYEDLERDDVLATLAFATRLAQIKRIQPPAA